MIYTKKTDDGFNVIYTSQRGDVTIQRTREGFKPVMLTFEFHDIKVMKALVAVCNATGIAPATFEVTF